MKWPVGQVVKTSRSQRGILSSILRQAILLLDVSLILLKYCIVVIKSSVIKSLW